MYLCLTVTILVHEEPQQQQPPLEQATTVAASSSTLIWSGRQQDLFRKYSSRREKSMQDIKTKLLEYKQSLGVGDNDHAV
jgi:hypothetical protein